MSALAAFCWVAGVSVAASAVGIMLYLYLSKRWARRTIAEFQRRFPKRCPICSYHRWGILMYGTTWPPPEHADCPERKP